MNAITIIENSRGSASGNRQETELGSVKDTPNESQRAMERPIPQNVPKPDTWLPRLVALDSSDCQTETVAMIPPVPKPRTILAMMNWANWKEVPIRMQPMPWTKHAMKIVHRRPRRSPRKVQESAPNVPNRVYRATTVPRGSLEAVLDERSIRSGGVTLDRRVVMLFGSYCEDGVDGRELLIERPRREHAACTALIVSEDNDCQMLGSFHGTARCGK